MDIKAIGEFISSVGVPAAIVFVLLYYGYKLGNKGTDILVGLKASIDHQSMLVEQQCKQNEEMRKVISQNAAVSGQVFELLGNLNGTLRLRREGSKKKTGGKRTTD